MGQAATKAAMRASVEAPQDSKDARGNGADLMDTMAGRPPVVCTFYYDSQVETQHVQLPLLYEQPPPGVAGTALAELELGLRARFSLAEGSSVFAVVPADELYSPPYPLVMINVVAARLYAHMEPARVPVLHFALVVRDMALLKQPILRGRAHESPFFAVSAGALAAPSPSIARSLARRRFVQSMQHYGFARLEVTAEQANLPVQAFAKVRRWLVAQMALPKEQRWRDYVDVRQQGGDETTGTDDVQPESVGVSDSMEKSHPLVSRGRRVGCSWDRNREYMQLRFPIAASGTPWPPENFQHNEEDRQFANELLTLLTLLDNIARDCMKAVCDVLNLDEHWVLEQLLDGRTNAEMSYSAAPQRDLSYQYGASVLRIYNYQNKAPPKAKEGQPAREVDPNDHSCGVHADLGLVTVSPLATVPGLQMWNLERMIWTDVEEDASPLHFSVFAGETLGFLTHGVISAPLHRVPPICVAGEAERRMSMPYFLRVRPEACLNPNASPGEQISCRDFMEDVLFKKRPWRREDRNNPVPPDY